MLYSVEAQRAAGVLVLLPAHRCAGEKGGWPSRCPEKGAGCSQELAVSSAGNGDEVKRGVYQRGRETHST